MKADSFAWRFRAPIYVSCALMALGNATAAFAEDYDLLPLLEVRRDESANPVFVPPVGGYVRFWIEQVQPPEIRPTRDYNVEARGAVERYFWGRNHARVLHARLTVNRSNVVTQTVTLASATHESSRRRGENWNSEVGQGRALTPYFRVDPGTTASIDLSLSATANVDSDVMRNLLSVVERAARLTAPTAPLVTTLNSSRLVNTANFVDEAISNLLGEAVVERSLTDFPAEVWIPTESGSSLITVTARFPMGSHLWTPDGNQSVGLWRVRVTEPVVSIFSTIPLNSWRYLRDDGRASGCETPHDRGDDQERTAHDPGQLGGADLQACIAFIGLAPSSVLGLQIGENVTLGQALRGDAGIAAAVQRFQRDGNRETRKSAAREVCNLVAERADSLGLNTYDAAAAVWAFAWNGSLVDDLAGEIWKSGCTTADLAARLHLTHPRESAAQPASASSTNTPPTTQTPPAQPQTPNAIVGGVQNESQAPTQDSQR